MTDMRMLLSKKIKHLIVSVMISAGALFCAVDSNANVASIKYIHEKISATYGITVPVLGGRDPNRVTDMTYFMTTIDTANEMLHGAPITNYKNDPLRATKNLVGTTRVDLDIANLITEPMGPAFEVTVADVTSFNFNISAGGNFKIDWGDGYVQNIKNKPVGNTNYARTFTGGAIASRTIKISGLTTGYSTGADITDAAISFYSSANKTKMTSIAGDLGRIFPIIGGGGSGKAPIFVQTFYDCTGLTAIPADLFAGISGAPTDHMFNGTFYNCSGLTGSIPAGLFAGINGAPAAYMFNGTFYNCSGLTGTIPSVFFAGIRGAPAPRMFTYTFENCSGLTGEIPSDLFAGISGAPAINMFNGTFYNCSGLTGSIPAGLFAGINGVPAMNMFSQTFNGCSNLTGSIPAGLFGTLTGAPAAYMFNGTFSNCSNLTGNIPSRLFAGIRGAPAAHVFNGTFYKCSGLTGSIPAGLFGSFTGAPASGMFLNTFNGCSGLTGIDDGIWNLAGMNNANASSMFHQTFLGCSGITSPSPTIAAGNPTKMWEKFTVYTGGRAFGSCTKMSDFASIPSAWK